MCGARIDEETVDHLFLQCVYAKRLWEALNLGSRFWTSIGDNVSDWLLECQRIKGDDAWVCKIVWYLGNLALA